MRLSTKRALVLPVEQIDPMIRIAHQQLGPLNIAERIIFDHEFVLIVAGHGTLGTPDGPIAFKPGTLIFIRPFWPHTFSSGRTRIEHLAVHFDFRANLPPQSKEPVKRSPYEVQLSGGLQIPTIHHCLPNDAVAAAFTALMSAARHGGPIGTILQRAELIRMIAGLLTLSRVTPTEETVDRRTAARIDRAIRHIAANIAEPPTAEELALVAGLSPSHFTRLFREYTGYTPVHYLRQERIKAARVLLADVDLSIKEIASKCGFDDPYHFSKVFHQIDGLSPSEYRDAALAGRNSR